MAETYGVEVIPHSWGTGIAIHAAMHLIGMFSKCFFGFNPILGPLFGFKRVGLALRIQKRVDLKKGSNSGSIL